MFDIGITELGLLLMLGLLILGPERLPRVVRTLGGYVRKARRTWSDVHREIERELDIQDMKSQIDIPDPAREIEKLREDTERAFNGDSSRQ